MRRKGFPTAVLMIAAALAATETVAQDLWKLVAQSHWIVAGSASAPVDEIQMAQHSGDHRYVETSVRVSNCLKGDKCPQTMIIRHFTRMRPYSPDPQALIELSGQVAIFFLRQVDGSSAPGLYFAGYTPSALQPYSEDLARDVRAMVRTNRAIVEDFSRLVRPEREPLFEKVKALIEATQDRTTQAQAFAALEALGEPAVPAIIMLMDDRRELPVKRISLVNKSPKAFEGIRHYGPKLVVDAMAAILNQITGEPFVTIVNGGSEEERRATVDGWRVYLYRKRCATHNPALNTDSRQHCLPLAS